MQRACVLSGCKAWAGGFDGRAADYSSVRIVLPLRASASAMPPAGPRLLPKPSLRKRRSEGE